MCTTSATGSWILTGLGMEVSGNCPCGFAYFGGPAICQGGLSRRKPPEVTLRLVLLYFSANLSTDALDVLASGSLFEWSLFGW